MWFTRLSLKLFLVYAVLNLLPALIFLNALSWWQEERLMSRLESHLRDSANVLRSDLSAAEIRDNRDQVQHRMMTLGEQTGIRFTLIDRDGHVLVESDEDPLAMENHLNRPEVQQAIRNGYGRATRYSATLQTKMFYVALPVVLEDRQVVIARLALSIDSIQADVAALRRYLWFAGGCVGGFALVLTFWFTGRIIRPLVELTRQADAVAKGDYTRKANISSRDEIGTLARAFGHMQEELRVRIAQLRENSERLETVLSSMVEGVLAVDADFRILFANDASRRLMGIHTKDIGNRPFLEVARNRPVYDVMVSAFKQDEPFESECQTTGANRRTLSLRATRLPGKPCPGVVVVLHDITDIRRLDGMRREFVANVSHELKTPLSSIKAYAETLRMGAIDDPEYNVQFVTRIEEQSERLHQLILDLLHLARVESGKEAFDIRPVEIGDIVEASLPGFVSVAESRELRLNVESPDEPIFVRGDDDGLRTILDNLVSNAMHYTPPGGSVTIRWMVEGDHVALEVQDTGIGIAENDQERVFERFFRVDKARSRELGGTGLGLAIVKHLSQAFGGEVDLQSKLGEGSTFRVCLPLAPQSATAAAAG